MANTDNSVGSLYISLGLSLTDLESGFVEADRTVAANISRLNRESNLIRIRSQVEIAGLDETVDAERILQIRTDALNRQMEIQRDRVRLVDAELQNLVRTHGENSVAAQRLELRLERERLSLANLEREARSLNDTSGDTTSSFSELSELLPAIPTRLEVISASIGIVTAGMGAAAAATNELLNEFRELNKQSYELNMPFADTRDFLRQMRLAGGDIGDYEGYIRGITDAFVKGEYDDPEFIALRKYGAQITDVTGRLKSFKDISEEVYQAWRKADAAGEGIEFLQLTGGEAGVRDAIQYFKRLEEAREDAAKIFTVKIDDKELHKLDRTMNMVTEQSGELQKAIGSIFTPAANAAGEKFFQILHDGTGYIEANKDELQRWGFVAEKVFEELLPKVASSHPSVQLQIAIESLRKAYSDISGTEFDLGDERANAKLKKLQDDADKFYSESLTSKAYKQFFGDLSGTSLFKDNFITRAIEDWQKFNSEVQGGTKSWAEFRQEVEKADKALADKNPLNQYAQKRVQEFRNELEELRNELDFGDNDYQKQLADLDLWYKRESKYKNYLSDEERAVIDELKAAREELIDREFKEKIQQYWEEVADIEYKLTHTAFEKQLRDIEMWKEAQLEKASTAEEVQGIIANAAAKEAEAFESAMDRIRGKLQSLDDDIFSLEHSQYEQDLRRIQQKYFQRMEDYQKEGIFNSDLKAKLDYWYNLEKGKIDARAAESREKEGDTYTKQPEGAMQRGGNGIVVIGADQIIDDGQIKQVIGLIADESQERAQLMQGLSAETRERIAAIDAARRLNEAQKNLAQQASGFQLIEGDRVAEQPQAGGYQIIGGDQVVSGLQEFNDALQQQTTSAQGAADAQKSLAESAQALPPEYFQNLADGTKAISEMQQLQTESTLRLIEAQDKLATAIANMEPTRDTSGNQQEQRDGMMRLAYTSDDRRLRAISDIPRQSQIPQRQVPQQSQIPQQERDLKYFDWESFSGISQTGLQALALLRAFGAVAPHPALKAGSLILGAAVGAGLGNAYVDRNFGTREPQQVNESLKPFAEADLSGLVTPIINIDGNVQSIAQKFQSEAEAETLTPETFAPLANLDTPLSTILQQLQDEGAQELFGTLPNIEAGVQDILLQLQAQAEAAATSPQVPEGVSTSAQMPAAQETMQSFEVVVAPLNNIAGLVGNILTALENRQPPQITVSPNNNIDLGGAYVFDNAMKTELVNDITSKIVDEITTAVRQGVSSSSYNYGA